MHSTRVLSSHWQMVLCLGAQEARDGVPQTVGYSVSPVADNLLASSVAHRTYSTGDSTSGGGTGPDPPSGMLAMPRPAFGGAPGPLAGPPYAPVAAEPYVSVGCAWTNRCCPCVLVRVWGV